jgi:hypothetical protein
MPDRHTGTAVAKFHDERDILWKTRVDRPALDQLLGTVEETGAKTGAIFSNSGFTRVAIESAKRRGLQLFSLVDDKDPLVRCVLSIEAIHTFTWVEKMEPRFSIVGGEFKIEAPPGEIFVNDNASESVLQMFARKWNDHTRPLTEGDHEEVIERFFVLSVPSAGIRVQPTDGITFHYTVRSEHYLSRLPITTAYGVYDVASGLFTSLGDELAFEINLEDIIKNGERVGVDETSAVQLQGHAIHLIEP